MMAMAIMARLILWTMIAMTMATMTVAMVFNAWQTPSYGKARKFEVAITPLNYNAQRGPSDSVYTL